MSIVVGKAVIHKVCTLGGGKGDSPKSLPACIEGRGGGVSAVSLHKP